MSDQHILSDRDRRDIQGLVLYGTTCPLVRYHFFRVADAVGGRRLVRTLVDPASPLLVSTAGLRAPDAQPDTLVYVGFTWRGLEALAVSSVSLGSFPAEFQQGGANGAASLGDTSQSSREGSAFNPAMAHIAVLIHARDAATLEALSHQLLDEAQRHNCMLASTLDGDPSKNSPDLPGLSPAASSGMRLLGHPDAPRDGQSSVAPAQPMPVPAVLAHNGAFGVFGMFFPSVTGLRILSSLREQVPTDIEQQTTDEAVEIVVQSMMHAIGEGTVRDAHPKHHGLVAATVEIAADLPDAVRHGLFAKPGTYRAYIRYSNGRPTAPAPPDAAPDVRGMALKLFGVDGDKEAPDEKLTHDFILASHPVFFVPDVLAYVDFLRLPSLADKVRLFPELPTSFRSFENPLTIQYFSQTLYSLGPLCVKYLVQPVDPVEQPGVMFTPEQTAARGANYLREAMAHYLAGHSATLAFFVQLPPDAAAEQVDDSTRLWDTPPIRIATITIPAQDFQRQANDALAETISFSPWHCLHEHRPLGSVNLARRRVYREASVLRHANRAVPVREPDGLHDLD